MAAPSNILDILPKYITLIGVIIIAYLQTLFPSKTDFQNLTNKFSEMDKKLSELSYVQVTINQQQLKLTEIEVRLRQLELDIVKIKSEVQLRMSSNGH